MEDLEGLMQERPDGIEPVAADEYMDGFSIVTPSDRGVYDFAGLVAHRGVLTADEQESIDADALDRMVEDEFGYTLAEVQAVYKQGPKTATQREFRTHIDARMLALSSSGANVQAMAAALGLGDATVERALARARELYVEPQGGFTPAVVATLPCFICEAPGKRRKRRFSESPAVWVGTIVLCDEHYSAGFESKPGNPAYWASRSQSAPVTAEDAAASRERMRELLRTGR